MKIKNIILISFIVIASSILYKKYQVKTQRDISVLVVGTSADYPPYEYIDTKTGTIVGFDIDVIDQVAQYLGKKVIIKDMPFTTLIFALLSGEIDLIASGMSPTPRRAKFVNFSDQYLDGDYFVILSKKNHFQPKDLQDLSDKEVVVNTGHTAEAFMAKQPNVHLMRLKDISLALVALESGSADAFVCANSVARSILQKRNNADRFLVVPILGTGDDCAFAIKRYNQVLVDEINQALHAMKKDGILEQLKNKWNL